MRKAILTCIITGSSDGTREKVIASADIDDSAEVIERFMRKANPCVYNIKLSNGIIVDIPIAPTTKGFFMMLALEKERGLGDPFVLSSEFDEKNYRIRFE